MSYSDDRDEIAELFGMKPSARKKGYSEDLTPPPASLPANPASPSQADSPQRAAIPQPVKLRPPAHVEPHPLERPEPRSAPARPTPPREPDPVIEDEELLVYDADELPDFSDFDFLPVEKEAAPPLPATSSRKEKTTTSSAADLASIDPLSRASGPPALPPKETPAMPHSTQPPSPPKSGLPAPARNASPAPSSPASQPPANSRSAMTADPAALTAKASAGPVPPVETSTSQSRQARREDLHFESDRSLAHNDATGSLLQTHGLVKIYDGRTVVNGVDIHVRPGEIVGLLGPNGAGKTTSFYMIVGLVPPNGGQVLFNGHDVTLMPMYQRARLGMGYLPQEESIFRKLTVEENLLAVLETLDLSRKERLARCQELLERFSITHIRKNVALTCSGGEKRRLTIARSLVTMPSLLMLDEPFSGVDPIAVNEIQNIVQDLRKSGLAILITDHNARQTLELVDRAYLIYEGRVLREGTRDFLINDPVSRELYLGDRFTM